MSHRYTNKEQYIKDYGIDAYNEFLKRSRETARRNYPKKKAKSQEKQRAKWKEKFVIEQIEGEVWRPVRGAEEDYIVSNHCRVVSLNYNHTGFPNLLSESLVKGYPRVSLNINGEHKSVKTYRLAAEVFLPNPNNLPEINHKTEDKTNGFIFINPDGTADPEKSTIEWCDSDYNIHYGTGIERRAKSKRENAKGKGIDVFKNGSFFKHYTNIISAARELCIHRSIISHRVNGKVKSDYKGLTFQIA